VLCFAREPEQWESASAGGPEGIKAFTRVVTADVEVGSNRAQSASLCRAAARDRADAMASW
jgi:hypothetical protein